ncbi:MAG TPA: ABC transporter permease [Candidatus Dormibacteraeota bacterium]|nr:ABC transporter permease [Candidatus Dormibacteraeota bacterium]
MRYAAARIVQAVPLLLLVSVASFAVMHLAPGGPTTVLAHNPMVSGEQIAVIRASMGLDDPAPVQYVKWFSSVLRGNWGYSLVDGRPVTTVILERLPATLLLMSASFVVALALAVVLGVVAALRPRSKLDHALTLTSFFAWAMPVFWFGLMAQFLLSVHLHLFPVAGIHSTDADDPFDLLHHLVLPALVLGLGSIASWSRYLRSSLLEVLGQAYMATARAKGNSERRALTGHALRNAIIPLVTILGLDIPHLFTGAVVTETIFAWPGMGRLFYDSLVARDYPVEMGLLMVTAALIIAGSLVADLAYAALDPRIRLGARAPA